MGEPDPKGLGDLVRSLEGGHVARVRDHDVPRAAYGSGQLLLQGGWAHVIEGAGHHQGRDANPLQRRSRVGAGGLRGQLAEETISADGLGHGGVPCG